MATKSWVADKCDLTLCGGEICMNEFMNILTPIAELLKRKNTDYGNSYSETRREFGPVAFLLRVNDKFARLKTLTKHDAQVNDESIEDTLADIIGYCTLELRYRRELEVGFQPVQRKNVMED